MAIVPQFNGGEAIPVAKPGAPVLDRERRPRVEAGEIMGALGAAASAFSSVGQASQSPTMPINATDGQFQGVQALASGVQNLTQALSAIAIRKAQVKNYADVTRAETEMDVLAEGMEAYRLSNPDPSTWGAEWERRVNGFKQSYQSRSDLAPEAKEAIDLRLGRFEALGRARIETASVGATVRMAQDAAKSRVALAIKNRDFDSVQAIYNEMEGMGIVSADDRALAEYEAREQIESFQIDDAKNFAEAALNRGDIAEAKRIISESALPGPEKEAQISRIEATAEVEARQSELLDEAFVSPDTVIERLNARDETGWLNDKTLPARARIAVITAAEQQRNSLRSDALATAAEKIMLGQIKRVSDVDAVDDARYLTDGDKAKLAKLIEDGKPNDPREYSRAITAIAGYDPAADETGLAKADLKASIATQFEGAYAEELTRRLEEKVKLFEDAQGGGGEAAVRLERSLSDVFSIIDDDLEAGVYGSWMVPFRDATRASQQSQADFAAGEIGRGDLVEDLNLKEAAARKQLAIKQEIEAYAKANPEVTPSELFELYRAKSGVLQEQKAGAVIEGATRGQMRGMFGPVGDAPTGTGIGGEPSLFPDGASNAAVLDFLRTYGNP